MKAMRKTIRLGTHGEQYLLDVGGVHLDDIPVNRHLPQVRSIPLCGELRHLLVDEPLLLLRHPELHLDVPLSVYHSASPPFLIRVWDYPSKQFLCLGAGVPLNRKSASGYSLAVLAIVTLPSDSPSTNTTIRSIENGFISKRFYA